MEKAKFAIKISFEQAKFAIKKEFSPIILEKRVFLKMPFFWGKPKNLEDLKFLKKKIFFGKIMLILKRKKIHGFIFYRKKSFNFKKPHDSLKKKALSWKFVFVKKS